MATIDDMGKIAKDAHEKAATLTDAERWQYVASSVLLAFDEHLNTLPAKTTRPVMATWLAVLLWGAVIGEWAFILWMVLR